MHDLVHRERRRQPVGMRLVVGGEFFLDPRQPLVEQSRRTRIQRRKRSDDSRLALTGIDRRPLNKAGMAIRKNPFRYSGADPMLGFKPLSSNSALEPRRIPFDAVIDEPRRSAKPNDVSAFQF